MGASLTTGQKIGIAVGVFFIAAIVVSFGVAGGLKLFSQGSTTTTTPTASVAADTTQITKIPYIAPLAVPFTTSDGKTWQKVYDSMLQPTKYFISFNSVTTTLSPSNINKVTNYLYNKNMLPLDNPFKSTIDIPVIGCSADGSRLVLKLDLTKFGGKLPLSQGDNIYVFGINGETNANTVFGSNGTISSARYVYATNKEYPKYILPTDNNVGYIMLSSSNPCTVSYPDNCTPTPKCNLDNANLLFASGTYTSGGTVRFLSDYTSNSGSLISQGPGLMFYLYLGYKGYSFNWPYIPITADQAFKQYSGYYNGYMSWRANLPQTCTQLAPISADNFKSGPVTITGGSGSGMQAYIIITFFLGYGIGFLVVTNDGSGYANNDSVTITQGSNTATTSIQTQGCNQQIPQNLTNLIYLSYTTTPQQLQDLIAYVVSIDPSINTVVLSSNSTMIAPDNYNNPNMTVLFAYTTPDTTGMYVSNYTNISNICICNGQQDQSFAQVFFPNKISQCANQVIFTTSDGSTPYDFVNNATTLSGSACTVTSC